jgi:hypothetical protein
MRNAAFLRIGNWPLLQGVRVEKLHKARGDDRMRFSGEASVAP